MVEWRLLGMVCVLLTGAGIFLRLVAKESLRREKYLKLRLEEREKELKIEENKRKLDEEHRNRRRRRGEPADEEPPSDAEPAAA